jgi:hypothetical protein
VIDDVPPIPDELAAAKRNIDWLSELIVSPEFGPLERLAARTSRWSAERVARRLWREKASRK